MNNPIHIPVLLQQTLSLLDPGSEGRYLDLTAGYGGHASAVLSRFGSNGRMVLVDRDSSAIAHLTNRFAGDSRVSIIQADFESASKQLLDEGSQFDYVLADIGVSSPHLDNPDRGFSFMQEGPLDMRMDQSLKRTAADVVNTYDEASLADMLYQFGELHTSRRIASVIVQHRPYVTTTQLATVIPGSPKNRNKTLSQVFQALRIEVNDELGQLRRSLPVWHQLLAPKGKLAVITFHSLEDRLVKQYFKEHGSPMFGQQLELLTKRPIVADQDEVVFNPRSRSAKLRVAQRK